MSAEFDANIDIIGSGITCDINCATYVGKWSEYFAGFPNGVALLPVSIRDEYMQRIGPKSRNMIRKADKVGFRYGEFDFNTHLNEMFAINTSLPERQGKSMTDGYLTRPEPIARQHSNCRFHDQLYLGAYDHLNYLRAYCYLAVCNEVAVINRFIGDEQALKYGVMNGLMYYIVQVCDASPIPIKFINYRSMESTTDGLTHFKRSVGFRSYNPYLRRAT